jgi:hypothetical protein
MARFMNKNTAGRMIKRIQNEKMPDPKMINHENTKRSQEKFYPRDTA